MGHFVFKLSRLEHAVLLHELSQWERLGALFAARRPENEGWMGRERARELLAEVSQARGGQVTVRIDETDRLLLMLLIEFGTWVPVHEAGSYQRQSAAFGAVQRLADKIERAYGLARALRIPMG